MKKIKCMETLDWLMMVMLAFVLGTMIDYNTMEMKDIILVTCIVAWFIMLIIRLYLINFRDK